MKAFPWGAAMEFGFGVLRLSSEQFWKLTPKELHAAYAARGRFSLAGQPIDRSAFNDLVKKFPDEETNQ